MQKSGKIRNKAHIPLETGFALATKRKGNQHKKKEMYIANAKILRWGPNATYVPLTCVQVDVGRNANFSVFRYHHVGIGNAKLWRWGSKTTPVPNANGFESQWNIGLSLNSCCDLQINQCTLHVSFAGKNVDYY